MKYLIWAAIITLVFTIQGSISFLNVTPELAVVLACYAGIKKGEVKGMFIGSLIGVIEDSLSGMFLGPNLLSKGLAGYLSSAVYKRFFLWTPLLGFISILVFTFMDRIVVFLLRSIFDRMPAGIGTAFFIIAMQSLINAPFGLFIKPAKEQ